MFFYETVPENSSYKRRDKPSFSYKLEDVRQKVRGMVWKWLEGGGVIGRKDTEGLDKMCIVSVGAGLREGGCLYWIRR